MCSRSFYVNIWEWGFMFFKGQNFNLTCKKKEIKTVNTTLTKLKVDVTI